MTDQEINKKRIRESAPYRKSIALTELDLQRAEELERIYEVRYPREGPFNFSKTISKAIEVSFQHALLPPQNAIEGLSKAPGTDQRLSSEVLTPGNKKSKNRRR